MRRKTLPFCIKNFAFIRCHSTYSSAVLQHEDMASRYPLQSSNKKSLLSLLEEAEESICKWKLNKWEFRIPLLANQQQKERLLLQLNILKTFFLEQGKIINDVRKDLNIVSSIGKISMEEARTKDKAWVQELVSTLRWNNEISKAKALRDAFLRLEVYGARDYRVLQRLCAMYGLGMFDSFDDAFSNLIVEDHSTQQRSVQRTNPFTELLSIITTEYPYVSMLYDFLGFNSSSGYRSSLKNFLCDAIEKRHSLKSNRNGRLLLNDTHKRVFLYDLVDNRSRVVSDDASYGLPDFVYIKDSLFFFVTIASDNYWLRNRQLLHKKQMEGIGRRGSFVLGIPMSEVRMKNILLPPHYLDKTSLVRLLEGVCELDLNTASTQFPWINLYEKDLDPKDVDFCEMMKHNVIEEWVTL